MKAFCRIVLPLVLLVCNTQLYASDDHLLSDSLDKALPDTTSSLSKLDHFNKKMERLVRIFPLPMVSYSSETDWLIGLTKINAFRIGAQDQYDESIQPSQITALAYFTLNKQYKAVLTSDLMFGDNRYESFTQFMFVDFPNYYYGLGDYTKEEDMCWVETENFSFEQSFGYKINKAWYAGQNFITTTTSKLIQSHMLRLALLIFLRLFSVFLILRGMMKLNVVCRINFYLEDLLFL